MIYGFYFRFYKFLHIKWLSIVLSKLAYFLYLVGFEIRKARHKKNIVTMTEEEALAVLMDTYPDPKKRPNYKNGDINEQLDLSIIVPVYNYADMIQDNIESILNQKTDYRFELILVDDGSSDGARDIVVSYQDHPQVKVILQENKGIAGARNTGIEAASGKYLMFIDCDDTVHDDLVDVLMKRAYAENCDIVMCAHNLSKERNGKVYSIIPNIYPDCNLLNYRNNDAIMNFAGLPWCKVYKRELWNNVRFFEGYWYEDTIIQCLLFTQCKKFSYVPKIEYEYRWYEKNFSHTQEKACNPRAVDRYWLMKAITEQYDSMGLPKDGQYYSLLVRHLSAYYYKNIADLDKEVVEAMFVVAASLLEKNMISEPYQLPRVASVAEKAMRKRDIELWKIASCYQ